MSKSLGNIGRMTAVLRAMRKMAALGLPGAPGVLGPMLQGLIKGTTGLGPALRMADPKMRRVLTHFATYNRAVPAGGASLWAPTAQTLAKVSAYLDSLEPPSAYGLNNPASAKSLKAVWATLQAEMKSPVKSQGKNMTAGKALAPQIQTKIKPGF